MKIKYTQDILFQRHKKIKETTFPAQPYSRVMQPIQNPFTPYCQKCNLLIEKLLNLKLGKFPTLLKELQATICQTKQTFPTNPISALKITQKEQMLTPPSSFQPGKTLTRHYQDPQQNPLSLWKLQIYKNHLNKNIKTNHANDPNPSTKHKKL